MHAETLLHARWIVPVEPEGTVLPHHSLAIADGRIQAILPTHEARAVIEAREVRELPGHVLIPGFVNAHTHAAMTLFRGLADDLPLMTWLGEHIWPAEQRWVGEEMVRDGTRLAIAGMLRSGTTCFNDMYFFPEVTARIASDCGMRCAVGMILVDFPSAWAQDTDEYLRKGLELHDALHHDPLVRVIFAPHAPYSVGDAGLERIRRLAGELDRPVHMHVHETQDEIAGSLQTHGLRPLERLARLGLLSDQLVAVHMVHTEPAERAAFAASGAHLVHCPESNLKLASGLCPVAAWMEAGVNVALGTDGAASNNDLDLLGEMRTAALLAKAVANDASALPAARALSMATLNGARALGLDDRIGSLIPGKSADITAIDLGGVATQPVHSPISQLVYAAAREAVTDVWVTGRALLHTGRLTTLDETDILGRAATWGERMMHHEGHDP